MPLIDISYRENVVRSQRMVAESRRWLDAFYGVPAHEMTCLKCGRRSSEMMHLSFARRDGQDLSSDLRERLRDFGVCAQCLSQNRRKREMLRALNQSLREIQFRRNNSL